MTLPCRTTPILIALLLAPLAAVATGETGGLDQSLPAAAQVSDDAFDPGPASEPIPAPDPVIPAPEPEPMAPEPEPEPMAPEPEPMPERRVAVPSGEVTRATFTSAVIEREPIDSIDQLSTVTSRVYFFTELVGFDGYTVTHRWEHGGETLAEVPFRVRGPRWRVYSKKSLLPGWVGPWTVVVVDETGRELARRTLQYNEAPEPLAAPEAAEPEPTETLPSAVPSPVDSAPALGEPPEAAPPTEPR